MWLFFLACSNSQEKFAQDATEMDTSSWATEDADTSTWDSALADFEQEEIVWWKLSGEITLDIEPTIILFRDLYLQDMTFVCRQRLDLMESMLLTSPLEDQGLWIQSTVQGIDSQECRYNRGVEEIRVGVGALIPDLAVALDVIDWHSEAEVLNFDADLAQGAYLQNEEGIWAFGVGVQQNTAILIRPIYALKW